MVTSLTRCVSRYKNGLLLRRGGSSWRQRRSFILGIETSCDDTGVALINMEGKIVSESITTQQSTKYGGVIPTFAMHFHAQNIHKTVETCLNKVNLTMEDVTAVAVTNRPGLKGSLIIGTDYAKYLCTKYKKPMIPVHHMAAHALTPRLEYDVPFPFLFLLISGGHSLLGVAQDLDKFLILGKSLDDSPGEALDKIARRLKVHNLPHLQDEIGGRAIEILAKDCDPFSAKFPIPMRQYKDCNFSFSGFKSVIKYHIEKQERLLGIPNDLCLPQVGDICASIQYCMARHFCDRVHRAIAYCQGWDLLEPGGSLVVSGGVASNKYFRSCIEKNCQELGWRSIFPPSRLCTDNGVMIAWTGLELWRRQMNIVPHDEVFGVNVFSRCPLGEDISEEVGDQSIKCKWINIDQIMP